MQLELREALAHQGREAQVGDDERVEAGLVGRLQRLQSRLQLLLLQQRVERQVSAGAVEMSAIDGRNDVAYREVACEGTRTPAVEAQVDGVSAGAEGRSQSGLVARRRHQLRLPADELVGRARHACRPPCRLRDRYCGSVPGPVDVTAPPSSRRTRMSPDVGMTSTPFLSRASR